MKFETIKNGTDLTSNDIIEIIDENVADQCNVFFVCNKKLARFIYDYIINNYDINDEYDRNDENIKSLNEDINEYYVSLFFDDENNSVNFFVEDATGNNGEYKLHDSENEYISYYICVNLNENIVFSKLVGENSLWYWVKVNLDDVEYEEVDKNEEVDKMVYDNNCGKCDKPEIPDELIEEIRLIEETACKIKDNELCPVCLRNELYSLYIKGKNIGWNDHRDLIRQINEDD